MTLWNRRRTRAQLGGAAGEFHQNSRAKEGNMRLKIMLLAALILAACSGPDDYIGKWTSDGETLQLLKDGKVLIETQSGPASGTWRTDGYAGIIVSLRTNGKDVTVRMHIESGKLVSVYKGVSGTLSRAE